VPNLKGGQRKKESKKKKDKRDRDDNEKQDETKQLASTSVETKQKTSHGLCGETRRRTIRSTCN